MRVLGALLAAVVCLWTCGAAPADDLSLFCTIKDPNKTSETFIRLFRIDTAAHKVEDGRTGEFYTMKDLDDENVEISYGSETQDTGDQPIKVKQVTTITINRYSLKYNQSYYYYLNDKLREEMSYTMSGSM
jgi:hypothetical protein